MGGSAVELLYGNQVFANSRNLNNESIILRSTPLIRETITQLGFDKTMYMEGNMKVSEIYGDIPIDIVIDSASSRIIYNKPFQIVILSETEFNIFVEQGDGPVKFNGAYNFGDPIDYKGFQFKVVRSGTHPIEAFTDKVFLFRIHNIENITKVYQQKLSIKPTSRESSILELSIKGPVPKKEEEFLEKLIEIYIAKGLEEKNRNATNTINFIDQQLALISDSLSSTEDTLELFKETNRTLDVSEEANRLYTQLTELEGQKVQYVINQKYYDYLTEYFSTNDNYDDLIVPANFGITDPVLNSLIGELVKLQIEMNQFLVEGKEKNPFQNIAVEKKENLKNKILENINNLQQTSRINLQNLNDRIGQIEAGIQNLPRMERSFIDIKRIYDFNEKLYLLLMEKRAEAAISKASTTSDVSVVNPPQQIGGPTQPQTSRNIIIGVILSLLIPLILIYLWEILNDKILYREDIDQNSDIPFLGVIGHKKYQDNLVVKKSPKSSVAESFRTIRSNIEFFAAEKESKIVLITSSISSEGKTFCAINLASVFSLSGKKTVLIGGDMRKPKLFSDFGSFNNKGLSNYLINDASFEEVIQATNMENLDLITSGPLPPNPSELLMTDRFETLMKRLSEDYKYIILDTPPIGLVTDALIMMKYADHTIYVVRQNYTPKGTIKNTQELYNNGKVKNISILFNDVKVQKYGYGYGYGKNYGYGYGYYSDQGKGKKKWILSKLGL